MSPRSIGISTTYKTRVALKVIVRNVFERLMDRRVLEVFMTTAGVLEGRIILQNQGCPRRVASLILVGRKGCVRTDDVFAEHSDASESD
jgi:hypothetical protein